MFTKFVFLFFLELDFLFFHSQALSQNHHLSSNPHFHQKPRLSESLVFDTKAQDNHHDFKVQKSGLEVLHDISPTPLQDPIGKDIPIILSGSLSLHPRILQNAVDDTIDDDDDVDTQGDTLNGDTPDDIDNTFDDNTDDSLDDTADGATPDDIDDTFDDDTDDTEVGSGNLGANNPITGNNTGEGEPSQENQDPPEEILIEEEPEEIVVGVPTIEEAEEDPVESVEEEDSEMVIGGPLIVESPEENSVEIIEENEDQNTQEDVGEEDTEEDSDDEEQIIEEEVIPIIEENLNEEEDSELIVGGVPIIEEENLEEDTDQNLDEENSPTVLEEEEEILIEEVIPIDEGNNENLETIPIEEEEEEELLLVPPEYDCSNINNYHYPNRTCGSSCPKNTFIIQANPQENYKTCTPCSSNCKTCQNTTETCTSCPPNLPYLHENSTCLASCPSGTTVQKSSQGQQQQLCVTQQLTQRDQSFVNFVDNSNAVTSTISSVTMVSYQIVNPGASAIPSVILLVNLLDYIKYLNISFPPKLDAMFDSQLTDYLSFQIPFDFPESLQDEIHEQNVPWRFQRYEVNGLFLVNMWGEMLTAILVVAVAFIIALISFKVNNQKWFGKLIFWLQEFLIWNYVLVYWLSMLNSIVLFAIIEYQNLYLNGALAVISLILNIVVLASSFLFLGFIYYKLRQLRIHKYETQQEKATSNSKIKVLFEDFKSFYFTQELMIVISSVKVILYAIIIAAINAPVAQIILLILIDISMILYLVVFRPLKENWQNIELILYQTLALVANFACLRLALLSPEDQVRDIRTGDVIIITNFILISAVFLFQVLNRGFQLKGYCKERKAQKKASQQVHPNNAPAAAPAPSETPTSTASSTPQGGSETELDKIEIKAKGGLKKEEITELDLRLQLRMDSRRSSVRSLRSLRNVSTLSTVSMVVSLSDNTRTIIIRSNSNKSEENTEVKEKLEDEEKP